MVCLSARVRFALRHFSSAYHNSFLVVLSNNYSGSLFLGLIANGPMLMALLGSEFVVVLLALAVGRVSRRVPGAGKFKNARPSRKTAAINGIGSCLSRRGALGDMLIFQMVRVICVSTSLQYVQLKDELELNQSNLA